MLYNKLYGKKGRKMPKNTKKACVFSEGVISGDQNTNVFIFS